MLECHEVENRTAQNSRKWRLKISGTHRHPPISLPCSVLNKVERRLESLIQSGNLRPRKGPNEIRKIGLTKAYKVVAHNPA